MRDAINTLLKDVNERLGLEKICAIGVGTPGMVDLVSGKISGVNPNLPFWVDRDPRELFPASLKPPVFYDNDANLMALHEAWQRPHLRAVLGITVGSGIGGGFVRDMEIYRGSHGYAMEVGHIMVVHQGCLCACGRKGCLEAYSAVEGLKKRVASLTGNSEALAWGLGEIMQRAQTDTLISTLIEEGRSHLARALANTIVVLDPDCVVLGGGCMDAGLYDPVLMEGMIKSQLPALHASKVIVEMAVMGNRGGVMGAVLLAASKLASTAE